MSVCPDPTPVDWSHEEYYNPQNVKVRHGVVTLVEPCYITITFTEGDTIRFLLGDLATANQTLIWLNRPVDIQYHEPTKAVGWIKE